MGGDVVEMYQIIRDLTGDGSKLDLDICKRDRTIVISRVWSWFHCTTESEDFEWTRLFQTDESFQVASLALESTWS
jgi:hypothetical protein